jgi:hypothetical protein
MDTHKGPQHRHLTWDVNVSKRGILSNADVLETWTYQSSGGIVTKDVSEAWDALLWTFYHGYSHSRFELWDIR